MHQHIDFSKMLRSFLSNCANLVILCHVTFFDPLAANFFRQWFHTPLEHFARVADSYICAFAMECLSNSPGDRLVICQSEYQCVLSFKQSHCSSMIVIARRVFVPTKQSPV